MTASTWIRWSVVAVLLVGTLWLGNIVANQVEGWAGHALSHLVVGVPAAVFAVIFVRLRGQEATGLGLMGKAGWLVLIAGLAFFAVTQLVEAVAAFVEYPDDGIIHDSASQASALSLVVLLVGIALLAFAGIRARMLPRWGLPVIILAAAFFLFATMGGFSLL